MKFQTLNLLYQCSKACNHRRIRMHGLTDTECMICSFVSSAEGCSQDDVVKALYLDKTTVAKAIQQIEAKGLISRGQDTADRRKKVLRLTDEGKSELADIMDLHNRWMDSVMACLSEEEQNTFENYCERILRTAEEMKLCSHEEEKHEP